ncbi:MAG: hypothetical protein JXA30_07130 [Deltaproteobacteria bacterium]|nr:hypothetical protein [Deltaproteobacteria bacterium]
MDGTERIVERIQVLKADERAIIEAILDRMELGRNTYGPWKVDDGRSHQAEAFEEIIDALQYCAAGLVKSWRSGPRGCDQESIS